jgi:hypothetical protein
MKVQAQLKMAGPPYQTKCAGARFRYWPIVLQNYFGVFLGSSAQPAAKILIPETALRKQ